MTRKTITTIIITSRISDSPSPAKAVNCDWSVLCSVVLCSVVLCSVVLCSVVLCSVVLCSVVLCSVALCSVVSQLIQMSLL